jgi:hypothetical protein
MKLAGAFVRVQAFRDDMIKMLHSVQQGLRGVRRN